jgi:hypothetical protein
MSHQYSGPEGSTILTEKLLAANLPITGVGKNARGQFIAHFADNATAQDRVDAEAIISVFDSELEVAKTNQLEQIRRDFERAGRAGYDTGMGFRLRAGTEDQNEFNKLQTSIAMFTGAGLWNNDTPINVLDTDLQPHTVTIGQWQMLALGYAGFCLQLVNAMGEARAAILRGSSVPQVQSIHLTRP